MVENIDMGDYYYKYAHGIISEGYVKGGIDKLKEIHAEKYKQMEKALTDNFTKDGVRQYCDNMIAGLKAVKKWREPI